MKERIDYRLMEVISSSTLREGEAEKGQNEEKREKGMMLGHEWYVCGGIMGLGGEKRDEDYYYYYYVV